MQACGRQHKQRNHKAVVGREFHNQAEFDHALLAVDGTANKSCLGGTRFWRLRSPLPRLQPAKTTFLSGAVPESQDANPRPSLD